jgi:hypothetical protein
MAGSRRDLTCAPCVQKSIVVDLSTRVCVPVAVSTVERDRLLHGRRTRIQHVVNNTLKTELKWLLCHPHSPSQAATRFLPQLSVAEHCHSNSQIQRALSPFQGGPTIRSFSTSCSEDYGSLQILSTYRTTRDLAHLSGLVGKLPATAVPYTACESRTWNIRRTFIRLK